MNGNNSNRCRALAVGAWVASLGWFALATVAFMGFTPFSFVAWAVPAWLLLRRTTKWWSESGSPLHRMVYVWLRCAWWGLVATVVGLAAVLGASPSVSSGPTTVDVVASVVAIACLVFPPVVAAWIVWRTAQMPIGHSAQ
jgi:hypothetical protein